MKTFISALIIFALLCASVAGISFFVAERMQALCTSALALPATAEEFRADTEGARAGARTLCALWARSMDILPYFIGYDMLDRADDAALCLLAAAEAQSAEDFLAARLRFIDAAKRIALLSRASPESLA